MNRRISTLCPIALVVACAAACGGAANGTPAGGGAGNGSPASSAAAGAAAEQVRQALEAVAASDPALTSKTPLGPADYQALADKFAAVKGVTVTDYVGDTRGTIYIAHEGGGIFIYRHIAADFESLPAEADTLPSQANFSKYLDPTYNAGWEPPISSSMLPLYRQMDTYATHFPLASGAPDPDYTADLAVKCPQEGKIAIVDFVWSDAHASTPGLYTDQFNVDGVMLYDRLTRMAQAAGFTVDVYKDTDINLTNFTKLGEYTIVFTIGHGARPGPQSTARLGKPVQALVTPEIYDPTKTALGMTYEQLWQKGYILQGVADKTVNWTQYLFRDFYKPQVPQLVMLNECWGLLPFDIGYVQDPKTGQWVWEQTETPTPGLYNFGAALKDAGVQIVFGYISPATPEAVVQNTMPFFRRMFGGYSVQDPPPAGFKYWPTCMAAQTYFRNPATPATPAYANKERGNSVYTMYAGTAEEQTFRKACPSNLNIPDASMQDFMLSVGTPATAFQICWDKWWSRGKYPNGIQDSLCSQGDDPTTETASNEAACGVKIARQVTNAILSE